MSRVATIPTHRLLFDSIQRSQQRLADTQVQLATQKKAQDFADLGTETVRNLSARTLVARQEAHGAVANRLSTTLSIYNANISGIETAAAELRTDILKAIGTGRAAGLQEAAEAAFQQFRASLNAGEGGTLLFAGTQTDDTPFKVDTLAGAAGVPNAAAFANDGVKATARVADGLDVEYGVLADQLGADLFAAFRTLAEAGPIGDVPTAAQQTALNTVVGQLDAGLKTVRTVNAENGRRQAQVETLVTRSDERTLLLKELISRNEDANMAEVASELVQRKTVLEASYAVFAQLSGLSLINYLR